MTKGKQKAYSAISGYITFFWKQILSFQTHGELLNNGAFFCLITQLVQTSVMRWSWPILIAGWWVISAEPRAALGAAASLCGSHRESRGAQGQPAAHEKCKPCVSKGETRWRPVLFLGIHYMPACPEKGDKEDNVQEICSPVDFQSCRSVAFSSFKAVPGQTRMC